MREGQGVRGRSGVYPKAVERLIGAFAALPGIGRRSAERLAFHVLKGDEASASDLAQAILDVKRAVGHCADCFCLCDGGACPICGDARRDHRVVLVVEQPKDLMALEQTGLYRGLYHVLMGRLSPLDGIGPGELTVAQLFARIERSAAGEGQAIVEVILGLNPTLEGDGTALYLAEELAKRGVRVSRLARGLPAGSSLEYVNRAVLADAIEGRQGMT
ncbi:MAG: recombination mediator RecR [Phycisphaeraceae bacterium]|nr:recombination mediator RecR [Phycisphaeraceae bacterium]